MKLYVYDHCPYCVKARMIFGYKNVPFELITLLNDDAETPTSMIGQKMLPILEHKGVHTPESLDIIDKIDKESTPIFISNDVIFSDLKDWMAQSKEYLYPLAMPRWVKVGLKEFKTNKSVKYFTDKKEDYIGSFQMHLDNSLAYIEKANSHLLKLDDLLKGSDFYLGEKASLNDIHLYAILRSLSVVKGIQYPDKVMTYMKKQEELSKVPLHLHLAV